MKKDIIMDLSTRKLNFVQDFLKLKSEKVISEFEKLLKEENKKDLDIKPMSITDFQIRIEKSFDDSKNGKITEVNELISEIEKWS